MPPSGKRPSALHLVYSNYASDPRTRRQAEALRDAGWDVDVFCIALPDEPEEMVVDGVRVRTFQLARYRGGSVSRYLGSYGRFLSGALGQVIRNISKYDFVHVHSLPDFAIHAAFPARLRGAGVVLDIHDLVPELFIERFGEERGVLLGIIKLAERFNCAFSQHVLTANHLFYDRLIARGVPEKKLSVNLNLPDESIFWRENPLPAPDNPVLAYHGTLVPRFGVDVLLEAAACLLPRFPNLEVRIIGDGDYKESLIRRSKEPDLAGKVYISPERINVDAVPEALGQVTVGVVAHLPEGNTRIAVPGKLLEYLAMGITPVATWTEALEYYFEPDELLTIAHADPDDLAHAIEELLLDPAERERRLVAGRRFFDRYSWRTERERYVALARRLGGLDR